MGDPDLRGHKGLLPRPGRYLRRRLQGDVHFRGSRRRERHPAAGEHRRRLPRFGHQRPDPVEPAPQGVLCRADVPLRNTTNTPDVRYERPQKGRYRQFHQIGIEVLGAAEPLADAEVDRLRLAHPAGARHRRGHGPRDQHAGRRRQPRRLPRRPGRLLHRPPGRAVRGQPGAAGEQPAAHRRQQGPEGQGAGRRRADHPRPPDAGGRRLLRRGEALPGGLRRAVPGESADRPRPRLLQPHRLRIRHRPARRPGHRDGRRPLRRPGRGDGRPGHPLGRLGRRVSSACPCWSRPPR